MNDSNAPEAGSIWHDKISKLPVEVINTGGNVVRWRRLNGNGTGMKLLPTWALDYAPGQYVEPPKDVQPVDTLKVRRLTPTATLPTRAHPDDAGLDLYADNYPTIPSGGRALVSTGIAIAVPEGHVGLVCPRSGLAHQRGVTVANAPGIVDAGYRGEVMVNLVNHGNTPLQIKAGGRIAQLVIVPIATPAVVEVDDLGDTERGEGGHGSTGE